MSGLDPALLGLVGLAALVLLQVAAQGAAGLLAAGVAWSVGPRAVARDPGPLAGRLDRALRNLLETAPAFLALAVVAHLAGRTGPLVGLGIALWLGARVGYVLAYAAGCGWPRTALWHLAGAGLILMLIGVLSA
ncbi:MAG: MAPEG family protein [Alkalilacustris sp.]